MKTTTDFTLFEYKRRIRIRVTNESENQKRKRVNGRGGAPALKHRPAAVEERGVPTRLAGHALRLQGRRYPEARDLRWTIDGCCSSSITCYNRRFSAIFECTAALNSRLILRDQAGST